MIGERTGSNRWLLDDSAMYPERPGKRLVRYEVELLDLIANAHGAERVVVQGERLCRWARNVARARGWTVQDLVSPRLLIHQILPHASDTEMEAIIGQLGDRVWELDSTTLPREIMEWLEAPGPWQGGPDVRHAAVWLLWWAEVPTDSFITTVAAQIGRTLSHEAQTPALSRAYQCCDAETALDLLEEWLGIMRVGASEQPVWPDISIPTPVRNALVRRFEARLVPHSDGLPDTLLAEVSSPIRAAIGVAVADHLIRQQALDVQWFRRLEQVLPRTDVDRLRGHITWPDPGDVPTSPAAVLTWFERLYLPWRSQLVEEADSTLTKRRDELNRVFAEWYLSLLPDLLQIPEEQGNLAWVRANQLNVRRRSASAPVTLLVVLDGLLPEDSQALSRSINERLDLVQVASDWVFTMVPTVTEFTKGAIVRGDVESVHAQGESHGVTRVDDVRTRLNRAEPGDVVTWVLDLPDGTYHFPKGMVTTQAQVRSQLHSVVEDLAMLRRDVGPSLGFRMIVTCDHGRYLGKAKQILDVPEGLRAHGRAAWGPCTRPQMSRPYEIEGDIVWLNPIAYRLPTDQAYAVALEDASFRLIDGRVPSNTYPHGGLSPEEVIVPWLVFESSVKIETPAIEICGEGVARQTGRVTIDVQNQNRVPLRLSQLTLYPSGIEAESVTLTLDHELRPLEPSCSEVSYSPWPDLTDEVQVPARLRYLLPSGEERFIEATATLRTKAMYRSALSLEDLT